MTNRWGRDTTSKTARKAWIDAALDSSDNIDDMPYLERIDAIRASYSEGDIEFKELVRHIEAVTARMVADLDN